MQLPNFFGFVEKIYVLTEARGWAPNFGQRGL
jgi:hypothetical protein